MKSVTNLEGGSKTNLKAERGQATRAHLVATATRLFAEQGYEATSIEAVLHAAGVSRGALYHHFSGKEALFEAVVESVERETAHAIVASTRGIDDPIEALRVGCAAWLRFARDPVKRITLIEAPGVIGWDRWREIDSRHGFGLLKEALAASGRIPADRIEMTAHMLLAALVEVAFLIARADDPAEATASGQRAVDDLLDGLFGARR